MAWISGNRYLSQSEMENNARLICSYFTGLGWTLEAVSAMLGNMETESTINPNIWESLVENTNKGYGLVQWTPATKYINWAGSDYENGYKQCERIQYEMENGLQWFSNEEAPIVEPPLTFKEFSQSKDNVKTLANYFLWYYEHPDNVNQTKRGEQALKWYELLGGSSGDIPSIPIRVPKKKLPVWMMCRRF